jgi:hypothetical protein
MFMYFPTMDRAFPLTIPSTAVWSRQYVTIADSGDYYFVIRNYASDNVPYYFSYVADIQIYDVTAELSEAVSEDYIKITCSSTVDFGGTYYKGGFKQVLWKQASVERGKQADIEIIGDERNGKLVKEYITTGTKYNVRIKVTESEYSALVQNLPADWTITDTTGKVYTCNNLEISDPEWKNGNGICMLSFTDNIIIFAQNNTDL